MPPRRGWPLTFRRYPTHQPHRSCTGDQSLVALSGPRMVLWGLLLATGLLDGLLRGLTLLLDLVEHLLFVGLAFPRFLVRLALLRPEGSTPHSMYARAKVAEAIRRCCRDLIGLYGVTLPETDPEVVSMRRMLEMVGRDFPTPGGYPEVGEQAIMDRHVADLDRSLADFGVDPPGTDDPYWFDGKGEPGDSYALP